MEMTESERTARACLEELVKLQPDAASLEAVVGEAPVEGRERVVEVLRALRLEPEAREDVTAAELDTHFGSPVVLQLLNANWVVFLGCRKGAAGEEAQYAVFDPLSAESGHVIFLKKEALQKAWAGAGIFLRGFANQHFAADGRHTLLYCLVSICRHHNVDNDVEVVKARHAVVARDKLTALHKDV